MVTRFKHSLLALLLIFSLSFSVVFAEPSDIENDSDLQTDALENISFSDTPTEGSEPVAPEVKAEVFKEDGYYYYNDPEIGDIRTTAGFVTCGGRLYYIQTGGKILTGKALKIGNKIYHTTTWGPVFRGVHKWGNYYYFSDLQTGEVIQAAKFIKYNGKLYYIQKGGAIAAGRTFTVGKNQYRAYANGKIAVGAYRWGKRCYFSDPKTGAWIKKERFIWWNNHRYYIQPDSTLAANKAFVIKHRYPFYADGYCRVTKIPIGNATNSKVLKVAQSQVGITTGKKYWRWYFGTRFRDTDRTPWCGTFVGWCYKQAGMYNRISPVGNIAYVPCYSRFANRRGKWVKKNIAKGGDIVIFGRNRHVGIVEKVYKGYLITVEGNSGPTAAYGCGKPGAVTRKVYKLTDPHIKGVIHP